MFVQAHSRNSSKIVFLSKYLYTKDPSALKTLRLRKSKIVVKYCCRSILLFIPICCSIFPKRNSMMFRPYGDIVNRYDHSDSPLYRHSDLLSVAFLVWQGPLGIRYEVTLVAMKLSDLCYAAPLCAAKNSCLCICRCKRPDPATEPRAPGTPKRQKCILKPEKCNLGPPSEKTCLPQRWTFWTL